MGRIILEILAIFVGFNLGYMMGYKAYLRHIQDVIEEEYNKNN